MTTKQRNNYSMADRFSASSLGSNRVAQEVGLVAQQPVLRHDRQGRHRLRHLAQQILFQGAAAAIEDAIERLSRLVEQLISLVANRAMAPMLAAHQAMRRVSFLVAVTIAAEIAVEPYCFLADVISRIVKGHPQSRLEAPLAWVYHVTTELKPVARDRRLRFSRTKLEIRSSAGSTDSRRTTCFATGASLPPKWRLAGRLLYLQWPFDWTSAEAPRAE